MTRLAWGAHGERFFETGTDRGVLYLGGKPGVPWNGLKAVNESVTGGDAKPYYLDGYKYLNISSYEEFSASIDAFSAPHEFGVCDGTVGIHNGLFATEQPRVEFGLSYRTLIGNDQDGVNHGYKIHLVYNALASPSSRNNQSVGGGVNILGLSWSITTQPPLTTGIRPTAHFVIDSRRTPSGLLKTVEDILYGTSSSDARLPTVEELRTLFTSNGPLLARNMFTNPSFETGSGQVTIYENLFTNPSFETTSGTVEVWRNLALNPKADPAGPGFSSNNGALWTLTKEKTGGSSNPQGILSRAKAQIVPGTVTPTLLSAYNIDALANTGTPERTVGAWFYVTASGYQAQIGDSSMVALPRDTWVWLTGKILAGNWAFAFVHKISGNAADADIAYITGVTAVTSGTPLAAIAGDTVYPSTAAPDPDLTRSWVGTANASESVLSAPRIPSWVGSLSAPAGVLYKSSSGGAVLEHRGSSYSLAQGTVIGATEAEPTLSYLVEVEATNGPITIVTFVTFGTTTKRVYATHTLAAGERRTINVTAVNPNPQGTGAVTLDIGWHAPAVAVGINAKMKIHRALAIKGTYTGPYFDGSAPSKIRRNALINPSFATAIDWASVGGSSIVAGGAVTIGDATGVGGLLPYQSSITPVSPNEIWSGALDISVPAGSPAFRMNLAIIPYNKNGSAVSPFVYGETITIQPGTTDRLRVTHDRLSEVTNLAGIRLIPYVQEVAAPSRRIVYGRAQLEQSSNLGDFFDGSTGRISGGYATAWEGAPNASLSYAYDPDFTVAWSGTAHASTSKITGVPVAEMMAVRGAVIRSTRWKKSGVCSARIVPSPSATVASAMVIPNQPQTVTTTLVTTYLDDVMNASSASGSVRRYSPAVDNKRPNTPGEYEHRLVAPDVSSYSVEIWGGLPGGGDLWVDCVGVFEGNYQGSWFDGNSIEEGHTFLWTGTPDQSISEHYSWYF